VIIFFIHSISQLHAQCLSSVNPVGGSENLLVLEKNSLRLISFYKYGHTKQYYEGSRHSDFNLIDKAYYNYLSAIVGYGISSDMTLELETGYFINKTQEYNVDPGFSLTGRGLSNFILMSRYNLYSNYINRYFITGGIGFKAPSSRTLKMADNVKLPVEVQPTLGAYGTVLTTTLVKEDSYSGMRYFLQARAELNYQNKAKYHQGNGLYTSLYISKHLMYPGLKGDWTIILQLRNELRGYDKINSVTKVSSGSKLLFISPQINFSLQEKWNISAMTDIPVYQYLNGTQLGAGIGASLILSRTFSM
jgi:hypothetical protein